MGVDSLFSIGAFRCLVIRNTRSCLNSAENNEGTYILHNVSQLLLRYLFEFYLAELIFYRIICLHFLGSHSRGAVGCIFVDMLKQQILMKVCPDLSGCVDVLLIGRCWFCRLYVFWRKDLTCIDK